ncbi:flagellar basal body rod protein FlgB [Fuchsiella alkaliacetigena]|uniref:flagellar basal body rod protein FlgB n=1 Tax=Fuchsiella alkaliacetigena TaxID=957042 RepID=UPI00200B46D6|nr:flagellar basal body rod protein FlgB [Fuchsiella alkaliacetigena]MCK8823558.1 flagellar basal body rod protein FlgB [Fuchsiella alkaliacetigena]
MSNFLDTQTTSVLHQALDGHQLKHQAISNNIANVDTPNYKRQKVDFKSQLADSLNKQGLSLAGTNARHITNGSNSDTFNPQIESTSGSDFLRNDKNNVDIDYEMTALSKNTLEYQAVSDSLARNLQRVSDAINRTT